MNDAEVLALYQRAAAGDQLAWRKLVANLDYQVRGWVRRSGGQGVCDAAGVVEIEDLTLEAWRRLWLAARRGARFTSGSAMLGYLAKCARTATIDAWRAANIRVQAVALDELNSPVLPDQAQAAIAWTLLEELSADERTLLSECVTGQLTAGISRSTTYARHSRLRLKLAQMLE